MSVWTDIPAVSLSQLAVPADWNTYVKGNLEYLHDEMALKTRTASATFSAAATHSGDTAWAATGSSISITTVGTCDIIVTANYNLKNTGAYATDHAIVREGGGGTIGLSDYNGDGGTTYKHGGLTVRDPALVAGTYTYQLYHRTGNSSGTVSTYQMQLVVQAVSV